MKIVHNFDHDLKDGIIPNLKLEQFGDDSNSEVLFYGYGSTIDQDLQRIYKNYKRKVLLDLWSPTQFCGEDINGKSINEQYSGFDEIYSICPYTVRFMRNEFLDFRFKYIFHPFDDSVKLEYVEPEFDCVYFGGFHGIEHIKICETFQNFNSRIISMEKNRYVTDYHVSHEDKLKIASKCKISVVYNMLCLNDYHVQNVKKHFRWAKNRAFSRLKDYKVPQYKGRCQESAFARCVMIVLDDHWNVIKTHWNEGEHYISCKLEDLGKTISNVLNNYSDYENMIDSAFKRCKELNPENLVKMISRGEECSLPLL